MTNLRFIAAVAVTALAAQSPALAATVAPHSPSAPLRAHASGSLTILHTFSGTDGSSPGGALDLNLTYVNNKLIRTAYGETTGGSSADDGTIYTYVLSGGPFATIHAFGGTSDGANPTSGLQNNASDYFSNGTQLGVNLLGGTYGFGTLFATSTSGATTVVHQFTGGADGSNPNGRITEFTDGNFYGTTTSGALGYGTIFRVTPQGSFSTIYSFTGGADGGSPLAGLSLRAYKNGNTIRFSTDPVKAAAERTRFFASKQYISSYLYGVTTEGGSATADAGTLFRILPSSGAFQVIHTFTGNDGAEPQGELQPDTAGNLYGVANGGGSGGNGTVFELNTSNSLSVLHDFSNGSTGAAPTAPLTIAFNGDIYGTTTSGGAGGFGNVFRIASGNAFTDLHDFMYADGANPNGKLLDGLDGNLYGTAQAGGSTGDGVLFSISE